MKVFVSRVKMKGVTLLELLVGMSIGVALLAATLYVGTELNKKSSWEAEALALNNIGMQILQSIEEPLMNAGYGFGAAVLFLDTAHRYAIDVYPCDSACQSNQNYGAYRNIAPENLPDEIMLLSTSPSYSRSVLSSFVDPVDSIRKYRTGSVYGNHASEFQWNRVWYYAIKEKNSTWGCGSRFPNLKKEDNQDVFFPSNVLVYPCNESMGEFWLRNNYKDWRMGPLKESGMRVNFREEGPRLEVSDPEYYTYVGDYPRGHLSSWAYRWHVYDWKPLTPYIIGLKAFLGIPDPKDSKQMLWFPDAEKNHPYLSMCNPVAFPETFQRCEEIVNAQFGGLNENIDATYQHTLMRRVRALRLILTVQSRRTDGSKIELDGNGAFVANADGTFRNGKLTQKFERIIWPSNLRDMGEDNPEADFAIPRPMHPLILD
ncbi:MAG: hypothetical protein FWG75_10570 [Cystobacterineae bacterium]|nr:hypothetical protein [Cystobacterineae bacterium]